MRAKVSGAEHDAWMRFLRLGDCRFQVPLERATGNVRARALGAPAEEHIGEGRPRHCPILAFSSFSPRRAARAAWWPAPGERARIGATARGARGAPRPQAGR